MNYFVIINGRQSGPHSFNELRTMAITPQTPVWAEGMPDWVNAGDVPELAVLFEQYHPAANIPHTNWLPWAIVGTVLAFCTSCIGVIFGVIGILKASEANGHYAQGNEPMGRIANSNAKIMTIIALALDAIGIILTAFMWATGTMMSTFTLGL